MMKRFFWVFGIGSCALLVAAAIAQGQNSQQKRKRKQDPDVVPNELVVKLKQKNGIFAETHSILSALESRYDLTIQKLKTSSGHAVIQFKNLETKNVQMQGKSLLEQSQILVKEVAALDDLVEYAEPNYIYKISEPIGSEKIQKQLKKIVEPIQPNDPFFRFDWGLYNYGQKDAGSLIGISGDDIGATKAWAYGTGSRDIVVAVIDTGVDYLHEDLRENIYVNTKEIPNNGIDDDHNGYIDDVRGWNFSIPLSSSENKSGNDNVNRNNDPMDDNRHGTHCAGTIGASGNNAVGVTGVNWKVKILPLKFMNSLGRGSLSAALEAIHYANLMKVNVMSNSWGGGGRSDALFNEIKKSYEQGILFVAAAGNESDDLDKVASYPASYPLPNVISVAATDSRDGLAYFSNYGKTKVHLAAPGVDIFSTLPRASSSGESRYGFLSGTSMACPHVAGAAALLWSLNPKMNALSIKSRLLATVDPISVIRNRTITGGRLNIYNAITGTVPIRKNPPIDAWKRVSQRIETGHPYLAENEMKFEVHHPGAKYLRLHFDRIRTEDYYDTVRVYSASGEVYEQLSGELDNYTTDYIEGDRVVIRFTSDMTNNFWGFSMDSYEFID